MKILVTGHYGFIGSTLWNRLLKAGHNLTGLDIAANGLDNLLYCDFPTDDFDLVIHLAGKSGVRESLQDPAGYW